MEEGSIPKGLTFFVVGDIGLAGAARREVAKAMRAQLQDGTVAASFVIATGDNFYGCKSVPQFNVAFDHLQREMLDLVPLPWYFAVGNHDIKDEGARLHTKEWHGLSSAMPDERTAGWEFRCPQTYFSLPSDWNERQNAVPWDTGLLDVLFINTNKNWARSMAQRWGARWKGSEVSPDPLSWKEQKAWLRDKLASSTAAWKVVVGHHPIELVPLSRLEHGIPGVSYITSGFMKGNMRTRRLKTSVKDVVEQGGTDVYLCGHQHLMAHITPKDVRNRGESRARIETRMQSVSEGDSSPESPGKMQRMKERLRGVRLLRKKASPEHTPSPPSEFNTPQLPHVPSQPADRVDYIIVGSSSRLDQQDEDFEVGSREGAFSDADSVPDSAFSMSKFSLMSDESDVDELAPQANSTVAVVRPVPPIPAKKDSSGSSSPTWRSRAINDLRDKSDRLWHLHKVGYAAITVTPEELTVRFFTVQNGKAVEELDGRYVRKRQPLPSLQGAASTP